MKKMLNKVKILFLLVVVVTLYSCGSAPGGDSSGSLETSVVRVSGEPFYQVITGTIGGSAPDCTYDIEESNIDIVVTAETYDNFEESSVIVESAKMTFTASESAVSTVPVGYSFVKEQSLTVPVSPNSSTTISLNIATITEKQTPTNLFYYTNNPVTYNLKIELKVREQLTDETDTIEFNTIIDYTDVGACR